MAIAHDDRVGVVALNDRAVGLRLAFGNDQFQRYTQHGDGHMQPLEFTVKHDALQIGVADPPGAIEHDGRLIVVYDGIFDAHDE